MRATASKTDLLSECRWWARPDVPVPAQVPAPWQTTGTEVHALIETNGQLPAAPGEEAKELYGTWLESGLNRIPWHHEVAFAWNPQTDTCTALPMKKPGMDGRDRYKTVDASLLCGTADLIYVEMDGEVIKRFVVADIKTGRQEGLRPAAENLQLRTLALMAARASDYEGPVEVALFVLDADAGVIEDRAILKPSDLDEHALWLAERLERISHARPTCGGWCVDHWCPALATCPVARASVDAIALAVSPEPLMLDSPEKAENLLSRWKLAGGCLEAVEAALKSYADNAGGIQTPDGLWKKCEEKHASVALNGPEGREAESILCSHGFEKAIEIKKTAPKKALEAVARAKYPKRTKVEIQERKSLLERLWQELRAINAVKESVVAKYRVPKAPVGHAVEEGDDWEG